MSIRRGSRAVVDAASEAASHRRRVARRDRRRHARGRGPVDRRDALRGRRRHPRRREGGARRRRATRRPSGPPRPRTSAARSSTAPSSCSASARDELALLMTLEMGKAVAESKAEIAYAAEFFRWFSGEALRIDGYYKVAGNAPAGCWSCASRSAPASSSPPGTSPTRWARARSARRSPPAARWSGKPAKQTPLSMLALAQVLEECGLPPGVLNVITSSSSLGRRADHLRPAAAKALLHGVDRGRAQADRAGRRQRPQGLDGARRQRPVPDLRRRRPRRRDRGGDDREDAEHRRGLHLREPLPRRRVRRRRVRGEARRANGRAQARARHRGGRRRRPADRRRPARQGRRAGRGRGGKGAKAVVGGSRVDGAGYFYEPTVLGGVPTTPAC